MRRFQILLLILLLLPVMVAARRRRRIVPLSRLVFTHVTVIDATGVPPRANMTVVITSNRISGLGPDGAVVIPRDSRIIDARGKYMIPGLWDMDARFDNPNVWGLEASEKTKEALLSLFIAQGVTGIRDMGDDLTQLQGWRREIHAGRLIGPHIAASGPALDGPRSTRSGALVIATPEEGREAVRRLKSEGADFIEVGAHLPRNAYFAVAQEARALDLPLAGDVPDTVTPAESSDAGQSSVDDLNRIAEFYYRRAALPGEVERPKTPSAPPADKEAVRSDAASFHVDTDKANSLFKSFVKNGTWIDPTLIRWKTDFDPGPVDSKIPDRLSFLPQVAREAWNSKNADPRPEGSPGRATADGRLSSKYSALVGVMRRNGVSFLVGSGMGDNPRVLPGWSVHDELALLVESGLSTMEALEAATLNPAIFFGYKDWLGTVEKGKVANLLLLNANPLEDIHNTMNIAGVIFGGKYMPETELHALLVRIKSELNHP